MVKMEVKVQYQVTKVTHPEISKERSSVMRLDKQPCTFCPVRIPIKS